MKTITASVPQRYEEFLKLVKENQFGYGSFRLSDERDLRDWLPRLFREDERLFRYNVPFGALDYVFDLSDTIRNETKDDAYPYIPLSPESFLGMMKKAVEVLKGEDVHFVDAGCGIGDKVILAKKFFEVDSHGVEYSDVLFEMCIAKYDHDIYAFTREDRINFHKGDITTFDFSPFNLIYAYNPIRTTSGMMKFFENIIRTAKIGTVCAFANVDSGACAIEQLKAHFSCVGERRHKYSHIFRLKRK